MSHEEKEELRLIEYKIRTNAKKEIEQLSDEIQENIDVFESSKELEIDVLETTTLNVCKKCNRIFEKN